MALPKQRHTLADLFAMPESERGERYELLDGEIFMTPAPMVRHQIVSRNLMRRLDRHVEEAGLGLVLDNTAVRVGERAYVIPDAVFVSEDRLGIVGAADIHGAPDLVCEILSPGNRPHDLLIKRAFYARIGVAEYWIIDPIARSVAVLTLDGDHYAELPQPEAGAIQSRLLPAFRLTLADLFARADLFHDADSVE